jgi:hypothetical protein
MAATRHVFQKRHRLFVIRVKTNRHNLVVEHVAEVSDAHFYVILVIEEQVEGMHVEAFLVAVLAFRHLPYMNEHRQAISLTNLNLELSLALTYRHLAELYR